MPGSSFRCSAARSNCCWATAHGLIVAATCSVVMERRSSCSVARNAGRPLRIAVPPGRPRCRLRDGCRSGRCGPGRGTALHDGVLSVGRSSGPFPVPRRVPNGDAGPGRNGPVADGNGTEPGPYPLRNHWSGGAGADRRAATGAASPATTAQRRSRITPPTAPGPTCGPTDGPTVLHAHVRRVHAAGESRHDRVAERLDVVGDRVEDRDPFHGPCRRAARSRARGPVARVRGRSAVSTRPSTTVMIGLTDSSVPMAARVAERRPPFRRYSSVSNAT